MARGVEVEGEGRGGEGEGEGEKGAYQLLGLDRKKGGQQQVEEVFFRSRCHLEATARRHLLHAKTAVVLRPPPPLQLAIASSSPSSPSLRHPDHLREEGEKTSHCGLRSSHLHKCQLVCLIVLVVCVCLARARK